MANTVSTISYANTFGQWMVATDALIGENNTLAASDYVKSSGTLYLNETTKNSLQANGTVVIQKQLLVQGVGSSASIDNNLSVSGQVYFTNTTLGLTNSGQANINGLLLAQGSGTGLYVANNTYIGGNTTIRYNTITNNIQANGTINTSYVSVAGGVISNDLTSNNTGSIPNLTISTKLDGNSAAGFLNSLKVQSGGLIVDGNFTISGSTVYASNTFQLSTGTASGISSYLQVARGSSGPSAAIRWNELQTYWDILNVTSNTYYRILTNEHINNTLTSTSTTAVASANVANTLNTQLTAANTFLQAAVASAASFANAAFIKANSSFDLANTFANTFVGTTGSVSQTSGVISFSSNNGVTIVATAANNLAVSTSQDLRTTASPTFTGGTFTQPVVATTMAAGTSNTALATTAYVQNLANSAGTLNTSITGNSGTVTNGIYTNQVYSNPTWLTSVANTKISGLITASQLENTSVTAGSQGSASSVSRFTVDAQGRITSANSIAIAIASGAVSGLATSATTDTTNASNIASGTLSAARLPYSMDQAVATTSSVQHASLGIGTTASGTAGEIRATNNITAYYSDDRLKTRLGTIENALDKLCTLTGFYYQANETAQALGYTVKKEVGVSAQDVEKIMPEIVVPAPIDDKYLTVYYDKLIPLVIEAIKELKAEVDAIKKS